MAEQDWTWKVYHDGSHWWDFPYIITSPGGRIVDIAMTRRGARRLIRKWQARLRQPRIRERPIVEEIPDG